MKYKHFSDRLLVSGLEMPKNSITNISGCRSHMREEETNPTITTEIYQLRKESFALTHIYRISGSSAQ